MKFKTLIFSIFIMTSIFNTLNAQNNNSKVLIAYFSWSGNTKAIAEQIKEFTNGDLFEIKTVIPYSTNYNTCVEQAKKEKENNSRPEIIGEIKNLKEYNYVFIGYPNWWGTMPMPIYTFLENNNFEGITLIPFCTHGGGGVQQCFKDFTANTTQYTTKEGFLANGSSVNRAKPHVEKWLKEKVGIIY